MPPPFETTGVFAEMIAALREPSLAIDAYVDHRKLLQLLDDLEAAPAAIVSPRHYVVFSLYTLERWHRVFVSHDWRAA